MNKEEVLKTALFQASIRCVRANHADAIDKAYESYPQFILKMIMYNVTNSVRA